jgi:galactose-1-phosphate uridylyltransferase
MCFNRAMLALLRPKNNSFNACRSQNLNHFFTAALSQLIRKESAIANYDAKCRAYAHMVIATPSQTGSCPEYAPAHAPLVPPILRFAGKVSPVLAERFKTQFQYPLKIQDVETPS